MPRNGYWVECVPATAEQINISQEIVAGGYVASPTSFPDVHETASTPDEAINRIRDRLIKVRKTYSQSGKILPEMDNPVRPPNRLRNVQGWISVYIVLSENARSEA